jgi:predicted RNA-binding protein YlqC (UPF0109 family)
MYIVYAKENNIYKKDCKENTYHLVRLLERLKEFQAKNPSEELCIQFEEGEYHFYPDFAKEKTLYISNHDEDTLKRCAFYLEGFRNLHIKGLDSHFIFHTELIPFYVNESEHITIESVTMDYAVPSYSEATVVETGINRMVIHMDTLKYPIEIQNGEALFPRENGTHSLIWWLEMDKERLAPAYDIKDMVFGFEEKKERPSIWTDLGNGYYEITLTKKGDCFPENSKASNRLILRHHLRTHPAIYITDSANIMLKDVVLYHAVGMGVIAERSFDITLEKVEVKIHPQKQRIFTTTADATHFVLCGGKIYLKECLFENQLDDPINVHGIYTRIEKIESDSKILVQLVHNQHKGVCFGKKGQTVQCVRQDTMIGYHKTTIQSITPLNKDFIQIEFMEPCKEMQVGDAVENLFYVPNVHIEHCVFQNNRARGALLTSAGEVLVENNIFRTAGAAILIEGDARSWFESGATKHIVIRNNRFENCSYVTDWGEAPIQVSPSVLKAEGKVRYHKHIIIEQNQFECFDERLLYAKHVEKLEWKENIVIHSKMFPPLGKEKFLLDEVVEFILQ